MSSPLRDALSASAASSDPLASLIGSTALEYLDTRDRDLVLKIPQGGPAEAGQAASLAITTAAGHPDSNALLELAALLIADHRYRDPLVYPEGHRYGIGNVLAHLSDPTAFQTGFLALLTAARRVSVPDEEIARYFLLEHRRAFDERVTRREDLPDGYWDDPRFFRYCLPDSWSPATPSEELIWGLSDDVLGWLANAEGPGHAGAMNWGLDFGAQRVCIYFIAILAKFRPSALKPWVDRQLSLGVRDDAWEFVLKVTDQFDQEALELAKNLSPRERLVQLIQLSGLRGEPYTTLAREASLSTGEEEHAMAMSFLADRFPKDLAVRMSRAVKEGELDYGISQLTYDKAFSALSAILDEGGREVFEAVFAGECHATGNHGTRNGTRSLYSDAMHALLATVPLLPEDQLRAWIARSAQGVLESGEDQKSINSLFERLLWEVVEVNPSLIREQLFVILGEKVKTLRQLAVQGLAKIADDDLTSRTAVLLTSGKADQKLGAAALLGAIRTTDSSAALQSALQSETNDKVRAAIHEALQASGKSAPGSPSAGEAASEAETSLSDLEAGFAKQASKLKVPSTSWLKVEELPPLLATDGAQLSAHAIAFLLSKQAKHKSIEPAPDTLPLLKHIDRTKSAPFADALVKGFLNSEQAAADRWAFALGGMLGDNRVIPLLLSRINDWCENSRHKLAEYAAQAIALLPGNEPLMVLDTLSNRYRSKFKNVGKACGEAFAAAAAARGITPDELGDMVVPDFGFDADGVRRFDWAGGGASAELGPDFKLSWFDPETDKAWKALPASAPEEIKTEVKTLTKLLKEAVKGQTARLEMALVRQRRWPVARWRELYENHPLLRSFASNLVCGIYDTSGNLLRTFRRYPNGLLANTEGDLEELPEPDTQVGMVHPLELDAAALDAWRAHLARFKVKPPFPQIDRPVELMDPLHGNRREISITKDKELGAGTFKSRSEKRGWIRGSVADAGGITSVYKLFPGAGVEAILATESYWVSIDPMDSVELGGAYFVAAGTVQRGSYIYDDPGPDDPRVLRFDQVPAIVWSETMSDLKAIIGQA